MDPKPIIESVSYLTNATIEVDTLRLDQIHPIVSGNKWYKLRYYIQDALTKKATTIASFGGPYSNHLVALAYTAKQQGLKSKGYVRSNEGEPLTHSMQEAMNYGMEFIYLGRTLFQEKKTEILSSNVNTNPETYFIDEGGYGHLGAKGASTILTNNTAIISNYDIIICAVGTGTMIAGIINAAEKNQHIIGIPVLKNEFTISNEIEQLLSEEKKCRPNFTLLHDFHQGGYAKTTPEQIAFMNRFWKNTGIPSDIVYTGKLYYAVEQLIHQNYFAPKSKVLVIHSGGLQGNRSLSKGVLDFVN